MIWVPDGQKLCSKNYAFSSTKQGVFDCTKSHSQKAIFLNVSGPLLSLFAKRHSKLFINDSVDDVFESLFRYCRILFCHCKGDFSRCRGIASRLTEKPNAFGGGLCYFSQKTSKILINDSAYKVSATPFVAFVEMLFSIGKVAFSDVAKSHQVD